MGDVGHKALALLLHGLQRVHHAVEGAAHLADLIVCIDAHLDGHIALRKPFGRIGKLGQRPRDAHGGVGRKHQAQRACDHGRQPQLVEQRQKARVDELQLFVDEHRAHGLAAQAQRHGHGDDGVLAKVAVKPRMEHHGLGALQHGLHVGAHVVVGEVGGVLIQAGDVQLQAVAVEQPHGGILRRVVDALDEHLGADLPAVEVLIVLRDGLSVRLHALHAAVELVDPHKARDQRAQHHHHDHQHRHEIDGHAQQQLMKQVTSPQTYTRRSRWS